MFYKRKRKIFSIRPHTTDKSSTTLTLFDLVFIFYHGALQQQQRKQNMRDSDLKLTATKILGFIFIPPPFSPSDSTTLSRSRFLYDSGKKNLDLPMKSNKNEPEQDRSSFGWGKHVGSDDPTTRDSFLTTFAPTHIG